MIGELLDANYDGLPFRRRSVLPQHRAQLYGKLLLPGDAFVRALALETKRKRGSGDIVLEAFTDRRNLHGIAGGHRPQKHKCNDDDEKSVTHDEFLILLLVWR